MSKAERRYYLSLGERIRAARKQRGMTQLDVALALDLRSGVAVHYWETGRHALRAYTVRRLERVLGTELYR